MKSRLNLSLNKNRWRKKSKNVIISDLNLKPVTRFEALKTVKLYINGELQESK